MKVIYCAPLLNVCWSVASTESNCALMIYMYMITRCDGPKGGLLTVSIAVIGFILHTAFCNKTLFKQVLGKYYIHHWY